MNDLKDLKIEIFSRVEEAVLEQLNSRSKYDKEPEWSIEIKAENIEDIDGEGEALINLESETGETSLLNKGDCIGYVEFQIEKTEDNSYEFSDSLSLKM